jgi:signal transduction histidine kinase
MESFIQEMKRYLDLTTRDVALLRELGPRLEKYFPEMSERFYSQIPHHPNAFRVFSGDAQITRLKQTLQIWARGLFRGIYDEAYASERFQIGYRHVRLGLEQKYVISAMGIVRSFLQESLAKEFPSGEQRVQYSRSLGKILDLDLNLMCESYMYATLENLQKLNEQLERVNADLAQSSRTKDEFLAHISHELRTPLNSILGFTKMILDGLCESPKEQEELLRDVFGSAQHLLGLVNDILDIRRIEEGKLSLRIEHVDLRDLLDSTLPLAAIQAAEKGLQLVNRTTDGPLPGVWVDEMRLRQVLLNLLSNAIKFTPEGLITVRVEVPSDMPRDADHLAASLIRLEVEDTGIGIPPDKRETVFEEFVQLNQMEAQRFRGAGLGLAISRRLVELMGGQIGIGQSSGGRGTLVWLTIPVAKRAQPRERVPAN